MYYHIEGPNQVMYIYRVFFELFLQIFSTKMKNKLQPTRATFSRIV